MSGGVCAQLRSHHQLYNYDLHISIYLNSVSDVEEVAACIVHPAPIDEMSLEIK